MTDVQCIPLAKKDVAKLEHWYEDDELANRYGGKDWPRKLWEILQRDPNRQCWMAHGNNEPIAYVDFELHPQEDLAWISLVIISTILK